MDVRRLPRHRRFFTEPLSHLELRLGADGQEDSLRINRGVDVIGRWSRRALHLHAVLVGVHVGLAVTNEAHQSDAEAVCRFDSQA